MRKLIASLTLLLALAAAGAHAAVTAVAPAPTGANVPIARATSMNLGWSVTSSTGGTVSSAQGVFRTATGAVLGSVNRTLSKPLAGAGTATLTEALLVPADVVQRAHKLGLASFLYERSFDDGGGAASGNMTLNITTAAAATFSISRLAVGFGEDKPLAFVKRGGKLTAQAEIAFVGSGLMKAVWEVAGPNPSADKPWYRVLAAENRLLAGSEAAVLTSPALPTESLGPYLVRLRITDPAFGFDTPVVRYTAVEKMN